MRIQGAQVFDLELGFVKRDIGIEGEFFCEPATGDRAVRADGCYAIPGLIDLHFHGCVGHDFSDADPDEMMRMARHQAQNGVTAICPATMTLPEENLASACRNMARLNTPDGAELVGIHLEGPFLSPDKLGAHNPGYIRRPDPALYRRLQDTAGGLVKLLAIAPELEGALDTISEIGGEVACSVAHTTADYETALEAFRRGARQVTHLYNAMPPFAHRAPGVIGAALDTPHCMVELICDGVHIHPSAVRAAFRMFGGSRILLISDSMRAAGLKDGVYDLGGQLVDVKGKLARLQRNGAIAGSTTNLMGCLRTAVREMGISLHTAVRCASFNPARVLGLSDRGGVAPGMVADLVLLEPDLSIRQVFLRGKPLLG